MAPIPKRVVLPVVVTTVVVESAEMVETSGEVVRADEEAEPVALVPDAVDEVEARAAAQTELP